MNKKNVAEIDLFIQVFNLHILNILMSYPSSGRHRRETAIMGDNQSSQYKLLSFIAERDNTNDRTAQVSHRWTLYPDAATQPKPLPINERRSTLYRLLTIFPQFAMYNVFRIWCAGFSCSVIAPLSGQKRDRTLGDFREMIAIKDVA